MSCFLEIKTKGNKQRPERIEIITQNSFTSLQNVRTNIFLHFIRPERAAVFPPLGSRVSDEFHSGAIDGFLLCVVCYYTIGLFGC